MGCQKQEKTCRPQGKDWGRLISRRWLLLQQWRPAAGEDLVKSLRGVMPVASNPAHDHNAVNLGKQRERIRDSGKRRRVDHNEVVRRPRMWSTLSIARLSINSPGLGGSTTPAASRSSVLSSAPLSERSIQGNRLRGDAHLHGADQHVGQTWTRLDVEMLYERRMPQIGL